MGRGRGDYFQVLKSIRQPVLLASISSDVLYPVSEQLELAEHMPNAQHHMIESNEGHDGFLLEHRKVSTLMRGFLAERRMIAIGAWAGSARPSRASGIVTALG